ncbi:MAG: spermidine synthase [Thermodesulfobacteriota bacterium]
MKKSFEELDSQETRMGELSLRRRRIRSLNNIEVYEIKLGNEYLMSSLLHEAEVALADIGLGALGGEGWDVVVGGLGLGYTAAAALKFEKLERLLVVEALDPVIAWHKRGLIPQGRQLTADSRCILRHDDFFALARQTGFDPVRPQSQFDAILLDIDHTPDFWLHPSHADFYSAAGLSRLKSSLKPRGVFALWSNDPPESAFIDILSSVFTDVRGHSVQFDNPLQQATSTNGVYVARRE